MSLVQNFLELVGRVKSLETKVAELEKKAAQQPTVVTVVQPGSVPSKKTPIKKLCPHCNAAPAYFFHVKHCQTKRKINGENGSSGSA